MQHFIDGEENETPKKNKYIKKLRLALFYIIFAPIIIFMTSTIINAIARKREEKRYRKIIKKGLFWDTEYLIEK